MTSSAARPLRIVVGVTGGIAAYKAISVIRAFVLDGHHVNVIATEAALQFVGRPTLEAISRNLVHTDLYDGVAEVRHVALGQQADLIVIVPATANSLANIAGGHAPDLLGNTILARRCPLIVAPAMHTEMWNNPATQANIALLHERDVRIVGPGAGALTGNDVGLGRMSEPAEIVDASYAALTLVEQDLSGKRILITGGGTREAIDPVRFIGNRSSGRQAVALAEAAVARGADVTLVAAHLEVDPPHGVRTIAVSSTAELSATLELESPGHDVIIMAAAVADYRPADVSESKLKKATLGESPHLELIQNPDLLLGLAQSARADQIIIGFAAETENDPEKLLALGREKLARKNCDVLVVNAVGWTAGFGSPRNDVIILGRGGDILNEGSGDKRAIAELILDTAR
jgi:phosphopantothenoylcysteine decarboxylase/phosphopantothenate--cysteine ligase